MAKFNIHKREIKTILWLVGLGVLFITDTVWPGILFLVVLSILADILFKPQAADVTEVDAYDHQPEEHKDKDVQQSKPAGLDAPEQASGAVNTVHDVSILPARCPSCGAPVAAEKVRWVGEKTAQCPYCNTILK